MTTIGFLHPGAMGETLASCCNSTDRWWVSAGRSAASVGRATAAGLHDAGTLAALVERCDTIVSICPPGEAETVATDVADAGFRGTYVDANAIAPATARRIAVRFRHYVDGSVVGPPAHSAGTTRLFLSGDSAPAVAELWADSKLDAVVIDGGPGAASAVKMGYAASTKIRAALELTIRAYAAAEGVEGPLVDEWNRSQPGFVERTVGAAAAVGPKAWRFVGEMEQMAEAYADVGLPDGFALAAATAYRRLDDLRDLPAPSLDDIVSRMS